MSNQTMVRKYARDLRQTLAENLRFLRSKRDLSQEQLADLCGLHRTYVGSVERCERNVTLGALAGLAAGLGVAVTDLLMRKEKRDA